MRLPPRPSAGQRRASGPGGGGGAEPVRASNLCVQGCRDLCRDTFPPAQQEVRTPAQPCSLQGNQARQPVLPLPDKDSDQWAPPAWTGRSDCQLHPTGEVPARVREGEMAPLHENLPLLSARVSRARRRGPRDSHVRLTPCPLAHPLGPRWEKLKPCSE